MIEILYKDLTENKRDSECIMYDTFREAFIDLIDHLANNWSINFTSFPARVSVNYMRAPFEKKVCFTELENDEELEEKEK